jgi:hypothetical protein
VFQLHDGGLLSGEEVTEAQVEVGQGSLFNLVSFACEIKLKVIYCQFDKIYATINVDSKKYGDR